MNTIEPMRKRRRQSCDLHWGDWPACRTKLRQGPTRRLIDFLAHHPGDFRGAMARLRPELQGLYLAAWQSHLWNRMLARWLETHLTREQLGTISLQLGDFPVPMGISSECRAEWETLHLPLPSCATAHRPFGRLGFSD